MRKFATIGMSLVTAASISIPALAMSSAFAAPVPTVHGGHRVNAIAACDRAIEQLRLALQYDKR